MFYVFPKAVRLELCNEIIRDCKENILEEASIHEPTTRFSRNDPDIRKTSVNFIKDKDNKVNKLAWHFLEEANKRKK